MDLPMNLTPATKRFMDRVVNTLETGSPDGAYGAVVTQCDGPHLIEQITYGRSRATEYGTLRALLERYADCNGVYAADLSRYLDRLGAVPLTDDRKFRSLLRAAGRDPVMHQVQDRLTDEQGFDPAMRWAAEQGLKLPLSALVVYDSFVHSGSVLPLIRRAVAVPLPAAGGDERAWTTAYVEARHRWLLEHRRVDIQRTTYRTQCLAEQIRRGNWELEVRPVRVNGVAVG